jgi:hypothetical protein
MCNGYLITKFRLVAFGLRGGENKMEVLAEVDGVWRVVIDEFVPTHGNDGNIWPISHIVEPSGIRNGKVDD